MANAIEPTIEESREIKNIGDALNWAGFPSADIANGSGEAGSLMALLGQTAESPLREVAALEPSEITM